MTLPLAVVTVVVAPRHDPANPAAPRPDTPFLDALCRYLDPRRLVTTELDPPWVSPERTPALQKQRDLPKALPFDVVAPLDNVHPLLAPDVGLEDRLGRKPVLRVKS